MVIHGKPIKDNAKDEACRWVDQWHVAIKKAILVGDIYYIIKWHPKKKKKHINQNKEC